MWDMVPIDFPQVIDTQLFRNLDSGAMTKRLMALAAMLLATYFLASQGFAATSLGMEPMTEACVLVPDAQAMPDCAKLLAQEAVAARVFLLMSQNL